MENIQEVVQQLVTGWGAVNDVSDNLLTKNIPVNVEAFRAMRPLIQQAEQWLAQHAQQPKTEMHTFFDSETDLTTVTANLDEVMAFPQRSVFSLFLGQLARCRSVECHIADHGGWQEYVGIMLGYQSTFHVHMWQEDNGDDIWNICTIVEKIQDEGKQPEFITGSGVFSHNADEWIRVSEAFPRVYSNCMIGYALNGQSRNV